MEYTCIKNPDETAVNEIRDRLRAYNNEFWEVKTKPQYALLVSENNHLVGGIVFSLFGNWLEIEFLWVDMMLNKRGIGTELLKKAEESAKKFGCKTATVNTMSFQAKPFYEKHGYTVKYTQSNYPKTSSRYYLEKSLQELVLS